MKYLFRHDWGQLGVVVFVFFGTLANPFFGAVLFFIYFTLWAIHKANPLPALKRSIGYQINGKVYRSLDDIPKEIRKYATKIYYS